MVDRVTAAPANSPPSEQDWDLFQFVQVQQHSLGVAAGKFRLSPENIRTAVARVESFLAQRMPAEEPEKGANQGLCAAQMMARMQLQFLYGETLAMWRMSQGITELDDTPRQLGKTCYLQTAARIAVAMAKIPVWTLAELEEESPPVRACSASEVSRGSQALATREVVDASDCADEVCDEASAEQEAAQEANCAPAQSDEEDTAIPLIPERLFKPPFAPAGLSRRERKAMRRRMEKALAGG